MHNFKIKQLTSFIYLRYCFLLLIFLLSLSLPLNAGRYNPFVWTTYKEFTHIYSIAINMDEVYFGSDDAILRFNRIEKKWDEPITKSNGFDDTKVRIVAIDRNFNKLWIVSLNSVSVYIPQIAFWERKIPLVSISLTSVASIGFNRDKIFLVGKEGIFASNRGAYLWQRWSGALPQDVEWFGEKDKTDVRDYPFLVPYYAQDKYFHRYEYTSIAVDNKDMWIGSNGYGVYYDNTYTWNGNHYSTGIANNRVDAIFTDGKFFWLGGRNGTGKGITFINFHTGEGQYYRSEDIYGMDSDNIYAMTGNSKNIWFGTGSGLLKYNKDKKTWKTYNLFDGLPGEIVKALILKEDTLFIGTNQGLAYLPPESKDIFTFDFFNNISINSLSEYDTRLLIGCEDGAFSKHDKLFDKISDPDGDFAFGVSAIFADNNAVWFGTTRHGIDIYFPDSSKWEEYLFPTPICGEWVFAISGNKDYVWIGTDNGVTRYNKKLKMWKTFNESDGLANNEVRTIYLDKDYVWFGTTNGLTRLKYRDPSVLP